MITITINGESQSNEYITQQWIAEQINNRRKDNQPICVKIHIDTEHANIKLSSRDCPKGDGGGKPIEKFSKRAQQYYKEWTKRDLHDRDINPGLIISFWKYLLKNL
ncbi:hypothetical protein [Gracilimonas sp.]|uniref:hypothetical protein n=1 Tax=Gracilimonas sp. TaxID=1974203 RepID=UPI003BA9241F